MKRIQEECCKRGIRKLCHFTQSRNLAHIFGDSMELLSTRTLKDNDMPHNPTDSNRYDGRDDMICCSIEHPNTRYFMLVNKREPLFKDWVVLLIKPSHLWDPETCFCPCNAARSNGQYIKKGIDGFMSLYDERIPGISFSRSSGHLLSAPTDIQAEVLVRDPVPLESIIGIAVQSEEQAKREKCRLQLQGISMDKPIYIAPDFFGQRDLPHLIQQGIGVEGTLYGGTNG